MPYILRRPGAKIRKKSKIETVAQIILGLAFCIAATALWVMILYVIVVID